MLPQRLVDGYQRFRSGRYGAEKERYVKLASQGQHPRVMVIACCDSRAAPETVFDADPGELFVVRNVANLVPPYAPDGRHHSTSAALEFAVLSLAVADIVVMGHGRCGGIAALIAPAEPLSGSDFIGQWMATVRDIVGEAGSAPPPWSARRWNIRSPTCAPSRGSARARRAASSDCTVPGSTSLWANCTCSTRRSKAGRRWSEQRHAASRRSGRVMQRMAPPQKPMASHGVGTGSMPRLPSSSITRLKRGSIM